MDNLIYLIDDFEQTVNRIVEDKELQGCGLTMENVSLTIKSFQGDEIASVVFLKKYALRNGDNQIIEFTLEAAKDRWAKSIVIGDNQFPNPKSFEYFRELYEYFLPGGRQMYGLGNTFVKNISYTNCYVTDIEDDSIEGIFDTAKKIAKTFSYGGGIGFCIGKLRPKSAKVSNTSRFSTGAVSFMELYSITTGLIGQNGRRAALLISIPVNHPDIEDFIEIKHNDIDKLKFANISIKITDAFMNAVIENKEFDLEFITKHETIKKTINAKDLWNKIIKSARDSAEPCLLFWDNIVNDSPTEIYEQLKVICTNPCGEIVGHKGMSCTLGSLLLYKFVKNPFTNEAEFNFELFGEMIKRSVRHLDDVTELNFGKHPLQEQEEGARLGRKIGLGVTGLADMLVSLNLKYDSDEAIAFVDKIQKFKMEIEYMASIVLAEERGSFPLYNPDIHYTRGFCSRLPEYIKEAGKKGLRNCGLSTVAPSGSISIIAQCSSGMEPIFALNYKRLVELGEDNKKEFIIQHPGLKRAGDFESKNWVCAHQIDSKYRIKMQATIQKYVDASISSTINLPESADVETVGQIYLDAWAHNCKGITVYRHNSREGVLLSENNNDIKVNIDTSINCVRAEGGDKFYVMVSYENRDIKKPYQIFVMNYKKTETDAFVKIGNSLIKMLKDNGIDENRITKYITRSSNSLVKFTRFLSLSMKTGFLKDALKILDEHAFVGTLAAKIYDILKNSINISEEICPNCKGKNIRAEEGCASCLDCGWSRCH